MAWSKAEAWWRLATRYLIRALGAQCGGLIKVTALSEIMSIVNEVEVNRKRRSSTFPEEPEGGE